MPLGNWIAGLVQAFDVFKPTDAILAQHQMTQTLVEDVQRRMEMNANLQAYNGQFADPLLHDPADTMDTVRVNKVRPIVDVSASFLFGQPPTLKLPKDDTDQEAAGADALSDDTTKPRPASKSPEEVWLQAVQEYNNWPIFLMEEAINGGIFGTAYVKFVPAVEDRGELYPKLQVLDPSCMTIQWHPRDMSHITGYIWQFDTYRLDENGKAQPITVRQRSVENDDLTWTIIDEYAPKSNTFSVSEPVKWIEEGRTEWPYQWSPVFHCKNLPSPNEVYGDPDIDATVVEANDRINFLFSNWVRIVKHHAHPKIYIQGNRGAAAELLKLGPKAIWDIPDPQAKVGQLVPAVNGQEIAQAIDEIEEEIQERTQTPAVALGMLPQGRDVDMSGVALRMKMRPLTSKTDIKRALYGAWIIEVCRRLFEMGDFGENLRVRIVWPEVLPIDPVSERQVALMDVQLQVPYSAVQENIGYDYEITHPRYLAEQEEAQKLGLQQAQEQMKVNGQPATSQMTPAGSQITPKGAGASKNDMGPSMQKQQMGGSMRGMPANNSRS